MPNPFEPKRRVVGGEGQDQLQAVLARLEACGAGQDDLAIVRENWPPEREVVTWLLTCTDGELTDEIKRVQEEYDYGTLSDRDLEAKEALAGNRDQAVEWIGQDPERARQALELERDGKARVTVLAHAQEVVDAAAG